MTSIRPEDEVLFQEFTRKLADKGWYTMHWPREYGGQAVPFTTQIAYREEMAYRGAPIAQPGFEAPMLMFHGQPWQRDFFLPKIASGELISWSQGFSEPNAGADLANLQTRAVRDGDDWVVTGQKILEQPRASSVGRLGSLPRADGPGRAETPWHFVPDHRHEHAGCRQAALDGCAWTAQVERDLFG